MTNSLSFHKVKYINDYFNNFNFLFKKNNYYKINILPFIPFPLSILHNIYINFLSKRTFLLNISIFSLYQINIINHK